MLNLHVGQAPSLAGSFSIQGSRTCTDLIWIPRPVANYLAPYPVKVVEAPVAVVRYAPWESNPLARGLAPRCAATPHRVVLKDGRPGEICTHDLMLPEHAR